MSGFLVSGWRKKLNIPPDQASHVLVLREAILARTAGPSSKKTTTLPRGRILEESGCSDLFVRPSWIRIYAVKYSSTVITPNVPSARAFSASKSAAAVSRDVIQGTERSTVARRIN